MTKRIVLATASGVLVADGEGTDWEPISHRLTGRPGCVLLDGRREDRILVGCYEGGLHLSEDGGDHFEQIRNGSIRPESVTSLAVDPVNPDRLYAGTEPSQLYRSDDGGESWSAIPGLDEVPSAARWSFPPRPDTHHVRWIEPDPNDPERLYLGIEAGALVVTPDGGETWIDRPNGSRIDNHTLATNPKAPGKVYSAAGDGYAESVDFGASWVEHHEGLDHGYVWGLAVDPEDPDTVVISAASGASNAHREPGESYLYRQTGSTAWERLDGRGVPTGPGHRRAVLSAGQTSGEFFAATDDGIFQSTDAGQSWEELDIEVPGRLKGDLPRGLGVCSW